MPVVLFSMMQRCVLISNNRDLTQKIIMNLGLDVYTEMTINEALEHIEKKIGIFTR
jgi:prefoldin subunit 5